MLLFGAEHGLPERGMSSTQAASEWLAGQQGAGSHRRQLQHLTFPPAVCSQHHYSPRAWWHPAKRRCKPSWWCDYDFMQGVTEGLRGAGELLPAQYSSGCCLVEARVTFSPKISASYCSADIDIFWLLRCPIRGTDNHVPMYQCDLAQCSVWQKMQTSCPGILLSQHRAVHLFRTRCNPHQKRNSLFH